MFASKNKTEEKCLNYFQITIEKNKEMCYNKEKGASAPTDAPGYQI